LRDRWRNLRDRFGPSKHLKKTLAACVAMRAFRVACGAFWYFSNNQQLFSSFSSVKVLG